MEKSTRQMWVKAVIYKIHLSLLSLAKVIPRFILLAKKSGDVMLLRLSGLKWALENILNVFKYSKTFGGVGVRVGSKYRNKSSQGQWTNMQIRFGNLHSFLK